MRAAGLNYAEMEQEGLRVAVLGVEVEYKTAARYDDLVNVTARVSELQSRMMKLEYKMTRAADGVLLATGQTKHLFINLDMKPIRLPEKYYAVFAGTSTVRA